MSIGSNIAQRLTDYWLSCIVSQGEALANGAYLYVVTVRGWDSSIIRSEVRRLVILR